jgi:hypothetical protein
MRLVKGIKSADVYPATPIKTLFVLKGDISMNTTATKITIDQIDTTFEVGGFQQTS